jgi:hypothetical protein
MTDGGEFSLPFGFYSAWGCIMNIHFEYGSKEKAPLGELIEACDAALALIHERTQLFKLLRAYSVCEEPNDVFNSTLERLQHLEQVSDQIQFALRDAMSVRDCAGGMKSVQKNQSRLSSETERPQHARAFSSEVETGSRQENASNQRI